MAASPNKQPPGLVAAGELYPNKLRLLTETIPPWTDSGADEGERTAVLFEDSNVERMLRGLARRFGGGASLEDELLQEALLCLWQLESKRPGQQRAWYLQGCRLHLRNYLRCGRSVDSLKRIHGAQEELSEEEQLLVESEPKALWEEICAHDLTRLLAGQLSPGGRKVLEGLVEGMSDREIARNLGVSHTAVRKWRRKIGLLALGLGVSRPGEGVRTP